MTYPLMTIGEDERAFHAVSIGFAGQVDLAFDIPDIVNRAFLRCHSHCAAGSQLFSDLGARREKHQDPLARRLQDHADTTSLLGCELYTGEPVDLAASA